MLELLLVIVIATVLESAISMNNNRYGLVSTLLFDSYELVINCQDSLYNCQGSEHLSLPHLSCLDI